MTKPACGITVVSRDYGAIDTAMRVDARGFRRGTKTPSLRASEKLRYRALPPLIPCSRVKRLVGELVHLLEPGLAYRVLIVTVGVVRHEVVARLIGRHPFVRANRSGFGGHLGPDRRDLAVGASLDVLIGARERVA